MRDADGRAVGERNPLAWVVARRRARIGQCRFRVPEPSTMPLVQWAVEVAPRPATIAPSPAAHILACVCGTMAGRRYFPRRANTTQPTGGFFMSPQAKAASATDTTSNAQGRFTVQLPAELRPKIAALGKEATRGVKEAMGIDVDLSMAQVVGGIINAQYDVMTDRHESAAAASSADDGAAVEA